MAPVRIRWPHALDLVLILWSLGTGEHGVGIGKKEFLIEELGEGTVNLMKTIKRAVDPLWLFNPGKVNVSRDFLCDADTCS
jgi:D-lactate dehydrogenase (cytochrome)